jgi:hypothetical protein
VTAAELTLQSVEHMMLVVAFAGVAAVLLWAWTATKLEHERARHAATVREYAEYRRGVIVIALPSDEFTTGEGI